MDSHVWKVIYQAIRHAERSIPRFGRRPTYNDGLIGDSEALEELKLREVLLTDPEDFPAPTRQPEQEEQTFDPQDQLAQLKKATTDVSNPESSEDNKEGQEPSSN